MKIRGMIGACLNYLTEQIATGLLSKLKHAPIVGMADVRPPPAAASVI